MPKRRTKKPRNQTQLKVRKRKPKPVFGIRGGDYSPEERAAYVKRVQVSHTARLIRGQVERPDFHLTSDLRATSDPLWRDLARFRRWLVEGGVHTPREWYSVLHKIRYAAHQVELRPDYRECEWIALPVRELRLLDPAYCDEVPDDDMALIAWGPTGSIEVHDLDEGFADTGELFKRGRRASAIEWAESWMNARERQLCQPAFTGSVRGGASDDGTTPTAPTIRDLATAAGVGDDTLRRVRTAAGIVVKLKGAAARNRRYSPSEVDSLITAALNGPFMERAGMAEKWAKWSSQKAASKPHARE